MENSWEEKNNKDKYGEYDVLVVDKEYVFIKGKQYMINICSENNSGIVISLFDSDKNKIATSKVDGNYASAITFPCKSTSIYYINYTFESGQEYCGGSVLSFRN